jgi:hypothetical protein
MSTEKTSAEKQTECDRICRPFFTKESGLHSITPEMCPIQKDLWLNPKKNPQK